MDMHEFTIHDGSKILLNMSDMCQITETYQALCTAEYLMDNHNIEDEEKAVSIAYEVRRLMDKYGYDEDFAITEALSA